MPLKAEFDSENRILRFHLEGTVTDESLNECYREIGKYAALTAPSTGILDLSKVTSLETFWPSLHVVRTESEAFAILGILQPHFEPMQSE